MFKFKKKNKESDVKLDIGLHPIEPTQPEKASKSRLPKLLISGVLVIAVIVVAFLFLNKDNKVNNKDKELTNNQKVEDVVTEESVVEQPSEQLTEEPSTSDSGSSTESLDNLYEKKKNGKAPEGVDVETVDLKEKGYILYENAYVGLNFKAPEKWYMNERTQEGFEVLRRAKESKNYSLKTTPLSGVLPIVDFFSVDESTPNIYVCVVPNTHFSTATQKSKSSKVLFIQPNEALKSAGKPQAKKIGSYNTSIVEYKLNKLGETILGAQVTVPIGKNSVVFVLTNKESKDYETNKRILEEMIKSLKIN